jgi:hypothetical protein
MTDGDEEKDKSLREKARSIQLIPWTCTWIASGDEKMYRE